MNSSNRKENLLKTHYVTLGRGLAIGFRYLGILYLSYSLTKKNFANFNLINSAILYILYFLGLDYYNKLHRVYYEDLEEFGRVKKNYLFTLICSIPITIFIVYNNILSLYQSTNILLAGSITVIIYSELFFLELYRFEILKLNLHRANIWLFLRYFWFIPFVLVNSNYIDGEDLLYSIWALTSSLLLLVITLKYYPISSRIFNFSSNQIHSIAVDLKDIIIIFIATICIRGLYFLDKWIPEWFNINKDIIATYAFIFTISSALSVLIDVTLTSHYYGKLLESFNKDKFQFNEIYNEFYRRILKVVFLSSAITLFAFFQGFKISMFDFEFSFFELSLAFLTQAVYNLGLPDHFRLFSAKKDRIILFSNLAGLIGFIICLITLITLNQFSNEQIFYSMTFGFITIFLIKKFSNHE